MNIIGAAPIVIILLLLISSFVLPFRKNPIKVSLPILGVLTAYAWLHGLLFIGKEPYIIQAGHAQPPFGIALRVSAVEIVIGLLFMTVTTLVVWFSAKQFHREVGEKQQKTFLILIHLLVASLLGIVFTQDLFNGFVFIEVSTLAACGIIVVKNKADNIKAAVKYLILSSLGSGLVLMGIAYLYALTGYLDMTYIHDALVPIASEKSRMILISMVLFMTGTGIKSALFPMHIWLPDAHTAAPGASSALLSGLVIKAPAIYFLKICVLVYGYNMINQTAFLQLLLLFSGTGMIVGSLFARSQKNIKRMIAYSSVAQMGYIFFGIGLGTPAGMAIAVYHMIGHGLTKSTLFLVATTFIDKLGTKNLSDLKGVGRKMPLEMAIFTICGFSMVGIPILPGFISKWNLALATIETGQVWLLAVILLSSVLNAAYYFPVTINGFFSEEEGLTPNSNYVEKRPLIILSFLLVMVGVLSGPILELIEKAII
ncbi:complex I subunit 5 family protein [Fusibacter sp. JL216-2]|uniref:complex I subunit 5 family protein n=1 Tax=Fusibacter sp. JL216-2 TaxID=3071453 RepID=UPI003D328813